MVDSGTLSPEVAKKHGLLTGEALRELANQHQTYLVKDFMLAPSINILVGNSGLGKTALAVQMGLSVCTGMPFLGHKVEDSGVVVYCDAESTPQAMAPMQEAMQEYLGIKHTPPNFVMRNENWKEQSLTKLESMVLDAKPKLVILDSLRNFYPMAIKHQEVAAKRIKIMRILSARTGCSWLLIHHLRKANKDEIASGMRPTVKGDIHMWLQEAAGTLALINNTDLRLGWERGPDEDILWLGGMLRVYGTIGPYKIIRDYNSEGEPAGYRLGSPVDQLSASHKQLYEMLVSSNLSKFDFKAMQSCLKCNTYNVSRFRKRCLELGLIKEVDRVLPSRNGGRPIKIYALVSEISHPNASMTEMIEDS